MIRPLLILLLGLAAGLAVEGPRCRVEAVVPWLCPGGWTPVTLTLTCPVDHSTEVLVQCMGGTVRSRFVLAAGVPVRRTLLIPPGSDYYYGVVACRWNQPDGEEEHGSFSPLMKSLFVVVGSDRTLEASRLQRMARSLEGDLQLASHGIRTGTMVMEPLSPTALPDLWQGYPHQMVLWFDRGEEARLDAAQRQAVQRWAAQGGTLVFSDPAEARTWTIGTCRPLAVELSCIEAFDGRSVDEHEREIEKDPELEARLNYTQKRLLAQERAQADREREVERAGPAFAALLESLRERANGTGIENGRPEVAIVGTEATGGWVYATVGVVFALVAGPGLLWWARRRGRPLLLVLAIPACGLLTCLLLLAWDLIRFGVGLQRSAVELTLVDPARSEHASFTGLSLFGALAVNRLSLADGEQWQVRGGQALRRDRRHRRSDGEQARNLVLDWDQAELRGDLVRGRITGHLASTRVRPDRRRIAVQAKGNGFRVVNGLGVALQSFTWRDAQGRAWSSEGVVADGAMAGLVRRSEAVGLPSLLRLPQAAGTVWLATSRQPGGWRAQLAAPLALLPGPEARDPEPVGAWACGISLAEVQP